VKKETVNRIGKEKENTGGDQKNKKDKAKNAKKE
jgi:hypothetical protein